MQMSIKIETNPLFVVCNQIPRVLRKKDNFALLYEIVVAVQIKINLLTIHHIQHDGNDVT